jgi:hypothetical protein
MQRVELRASKAEALGRAWPRFWTNTSARATRRSTVLRSSGDFRSTTTLSFERFSHAKYADTPPATSS